MGYPVINTLITESDVNLSLRLVYTEFTSALKASVSKITFWRGRNNR
jgi:hypothetical protein